jgi:hypothetical protein
MMLKVGIKLNSDLYPTGHISIMLHLDRLKDEGFSYRFIRHKLFLDTYVATRTKFLC